MLVSLPSALPLTEVAKIKPCEAGIQVSLGKVHEKRVEQTAQRHGHQQSLCCNLKRRFQSTAQVPLAIAKHAKNADTQEADLCRYEEILAMWVARSHVTGAQWSARRTLIENCRFRYRVLDAVQSMSPC